MKTDGKKSSEKEMAYNKCNLNTIYNKSEDYIPFSTVTAEKAKEEKNAEKFKQLLDEPVVDLAKLHKLAWNGIPSKFRGIVWKLLLKYIPPKKENQEGVVKRKREEYANFVTLYFEQMTDEDRDENEKKIMKIIVADVKRTYPESTLFRLEAVQKMMIRLLYIWHARHPASGYVQGMNDIITTFIAAFILDYTSLNYDTFDSNINIEKDLTVDILNEIGADTYWCLTKILDGIMDNYTNSHTGLDKAITKIKEIMRKIDVELYNHFEKEEVVFFQVGVRWVYCLLVREFPLKLALRLFDTLIADEKGFSVLHIYICAALLLKWSIKLKKSRFSEIMVFLQCLPTHEWKEDDMHMIIAEAYVYRSLYEHSPGHFTNSPTTSLNTQ
jgi:hypothetical protein